MLMQRLAHERRLAIGKAVRRAHADALDRVPRRAGIDAHLQGRSAKPVEQQLPERLKARIAGDAEADQQLELSLWLKVCTSRATVE